MRLYMFLAFQTSSFGEELKSGIVLARAFVSASKVQNFLDLSRRFIIQNKMCFSMNVICNYFTTKIIIIWISTKSVISLCRIVSHQYKIIRADALDEDSTIHHTVGNIILTELDRILTQSIFYQYCDHGWVILDRDMGTSFSSVKIMLPTVW